MDPGARELPSLEALIDPSILTGLIGPVDHVRVSPLTGVGYSNAALARVEATAAGAPARSFVLKRTRLDRDWTAARTGDHRGREALLLADPDLSVVWEVFACPYVSFARDAGEIGLLLHDLSPSLFPDRREPLTRREEGILLTCMAKLHARFWGSRAPDRDWLVRPGQYCEMLGPGVPADAAALATLSPALKADVPRGWESALSRLAPPVARRLTCPGMEWERRWADLPRTLLHGDVKVANFALLPDGRVAAFDWAVTGTGPSAIDLGWYLAVNASRLAGPKDEVMRRYRGLLESELGGALAEPVWRRLEEIAVVCGARMLLWSKALARDAGRPGALDEWSWWIARLEAIPDA
jgi:hypothetical protein